MSVWIIIVGIATMNRGVSSIEYKKLPGVSFSTEDACKVKLELLRASVKKSIISPITYERCERE